jgi:hypothetical protein
MGMAGSELGWNLAGTGGCRMTELSEVIVLYRFGVSVGLLRVKKGKHMYYCSGSMLLPAWIAC